MPHHRVAIDPIRWHNDTLVLLDQRGLPQRLAYVDCHDAQTAAAAIRTMVVRGETFSGAPAIGITAAYAVALSARAHWAATPHAWQAGVAADIAMLRQARPTAVNLMWALDRMSAVCSTLTAAPFVHVLAVAADMHAADLRGNHAIGAHGARCIADGSAVLTHCNAGALATAGYGTALGVVRSAWAARQLRAVYATETRPWLQGARLTAWELMQDGIEVTLLADSAAAWLMQQGEVQWVIVGADRIAANGDVANKIGTYALATLARAHGVRVMVAAPVSTIDQATASGADIPIEHRDGTELTHFAGHAIAAPGVRALNPVFDVTPAHLIDVLVTEHGAIDRPDAAAIACLLTRAAAGRAGVQ